MNPVDDPRARRIVGALAFALGVFVLFRWRWGTGVGVAGFTATIAVAAGLAAAAKTSGTLDDHQAAAVIADARDPRVTVLLRRYEVVIASFAAIVLAVRLSGGGFQGERPAQASDRVAPSPPVASAVSPSQGAAAAVVPPAPPNLGDLARPTIAPSSLPSPPAEAPPGATPPPDAPSAAATFADGGQLGDQSPFATVASPGQPTSVVVGSAGDVWVTSAASPRVVHYGPDGAQLATLAVPGVRGGISAIASGRDGTLYLASSSPAGVVRFDPSAGTSSVYATIPDPTVPCAPPIVATDCDGSVGQPPDPTGLAFDARGTLYVTDAAQGIVWRIPAGGGAATAFIVRSDWTNVTRPAGPTAVAVDGAGNLVVAVRGTTTEDVGAVYLLKVDPNGSADALTRLAATGAGSRPRGVALGSDGRVFVSLSGAGRVVALAADGEELARTPAAVSAPLDAPAGLAFRGQSLLVAVQAPADPGGGRIVRLPVGATGAVLYAR